jgi:hypothetical protein
MAVVITYTVGILRAPVVLPQVAHFMQVPFHPAAAVARPWLKIAECLKQAA